MGRRGRAARSFPAVPLAFLATAIALELALRGFGPFLPGHYRTGPLIEPDAHLGWRHIPAAVTWFKQPEFTARVETNPQGRLGPPVTPTTAANVRRVVLLGDSFVGAIQLPYDRTMAGLLPGLARERIEVVNEGVSGYGTDQSILALDARAAALGPHVAVLVVTVANDVWNNDWALESRQPTYPKPHFEVTGGGALRLVPTMPEAGSLAERIRPILGRSWLLTVIKTGIVDPLVTSARDRAHRLELLEVLKPPDGEWVRAWQITAALVGVFAERARALGVRPVLAIAPEPCQVHADLCGGAPALSASTIPQDELRAAAVRAGIDVVDLLPSFRSAAARGRRLYYALDLHWNEEGNRLAAEILAATLAPSVRSDP